MKIHVLPGDAVAEDFKAAEIEGEAVVCRECLIEGDVRADDLNDFWLARSSFISGVCGASENSYLEDVAGEFEKLVSLPAGTEVNLWFEYELFCQANMWFVLSLLAEKSLEIYRVAPIVRSESDVWKGFGRLEAQDLRKCYDGRVKFSESDTALGKNLWKAYREKDFEALGRLGETVSECFPRLKEVCEAEIVKRSRPKKALERIVAGGETDFGAIFEKFAQTEGVYGYGDAQVKRILQESGVK